MWWGWETPVSSDADADPATGGGDQRGGPVGGLVVEALVDGPTAAAGAVVGVGASKEGARLADEDGARSNRAAGNTPI